MVQQKTEKKFSQKTALFKFAAASRKPQKPHSSLASSAATD
jgi:hypothetical protein